MGFLALRIPINTHKYNCLFELALHHMYRTMKLYQSLWGGDVFRQFLQLHFLLSTQSCQMNIKSPEQIFVFFELSMKIEDPTELNSAFSIYYIWEESI